MKEVEVEKGPRVCGISDDNSGLLVKLASVDVS